MYGYYGEKLHVNHFWEIKDLLNQTLHQEWRLKPKSFFAQEVLVFDDTMKTLAIQKSIMWSLHCLKGVSLNCDASSMRGINK